MSPFLRITAIGVITWCLVAQLYFVAVPIMLWYVFSVDGYELILVSILVDGYYQAFYGIPVLTFMTLGGVLLLDIIKPHLMMYTGGNEMVS